MASELFVPDFVECINIFIGNR